MPFRTGYVYLLFVFISCPLISQVEDSIPLSRNGLTLKPAFDFDQRFSFIRGDAVNIWGERAGVLINDKFKAGVGGYYLDQSLKNFVVDQNGKPLFYAHRNLYFGTGYLEPFLMRKTYWELSIPIELGFGESFFKSYDSNTNEQLASEQTIFIPTGIGLSFSLKLPAFWGWRPPRWFGLNFLAGYRYCILENEFQTDYDGLFWSVSGSVFLDRVVDDVHYWKKKKREKAKNQLPQTLPENK